MTPGPPSLSRLGPLMATAFVDMLGFLIVLPLLPFYATRLGAGPTAVGAMVSAFALAQLLAAPFWGRWSDRHGRRVALLGGLLFSGLSHLLFALTCSEWGAEQLGSWLLLAILFLSRFLQGAGAAITAVVQAYVGETVRPESRAMALGWITAATSAGVMVGPVVGSLAAHLGPTAPGFVAAGLCAANFLITWRWLVEPASATSEGISDRSSSLRRSLRELWQHPRQPLARLMSVYALGMMAFMAMNAVLALFLAHRFQFSETNVGYVYSLVGAASLVMRSVALGPAVRWLGEVGALRLGLLALACGFLFQAVAPTVPLYLLGLLGIPVGTALLFPATTSLASQLVGRGELGVTMGVQQALGGAARLIGPLWAGATFEMISPESPFFIAGALAAVTLWGLAPTQKSFGAMLTQLQEAREQNPGSS